MILEETKAIIYEDIQKVLNVMDNFYIINKYKINTNLLNKCSIINNLKFNSQECNENTIMNENETENYIDILIKLYDFLIEKYDIFIIQNTNEIKSINEIDKLENIDENIDKNIGENIDENLSSSINDLKNEIQFEGFHVKNDIDDKFIPEIE
jgi:hypothetical protein